MARIYWNSGDGGREYSRLLVDRECGGASLRIKEGEGGSLSNSVNLSNAQVDDLIEQLSGIRGKATKPAEPPMIEGEDYR